MMSKRLIYKIEEAMRFIYAHFLEDDESLADFMQSRKGARPNIRHLVRSKIYFVYGCSYEDIGKAEAKFNGGKETSHSTISHSIHKEPEKYKSYSDAWRVINKLYKEFQMFMSEITHPDTSDRLRHYYDMDHHVLAVIIGLIESMGWVDKQEIDRLHTDFKEISEDFVKQELQLNKS